MSKIRKILKRSSFRTNFWRNSCKISIKRCIKAFSSF